MMIYQNRHFVPNERAYFAFLNESHKALAVVGHPIIYDPPVYLLLQNAVEKMRPRLAPVLASCINLLLVVVIGRCQELSVIRHSDGDIFTIEGKCFIKKKSTKFYCINNMH